MLISNFAGFLAAILITSISIDARAATTSTFATQGNPIRARDTADPGVLRADGKWYVYHTSSGSRWEQRGRYPILVSDDLTSWTQAGYIFEPDTVPVWAQESNSWWAPEVHKVQDKYIAYFTPRQDINTRFAVGAAVASSPTGPFKDIGRPLKTTAGVGIIDVSYFKDPNTGKNYLIWKEDQNDFDPPRPTPLVMQEMTSTGLAFIGEPKELIRNDQPWEGVLVEAPSLVYNNGWYYLFYSGNIFTIDEYSVGVARSRNVWGPYEKFPEPIMVHDENFSGPAHQYVIQDENGVWHLFYHARLKSMETQYRYLMHDIIRFNDAGWPEINDGHPGPLSQETVNEVLKLRRQYRK